MTSLGYSEYADDNGNTNKNNRRNSGASGGGLKNRTLKLPRSNNTVNSGSERGLINSAAGTTGITNENGNNHGFIQQAGNKVKQIKDYIENIHRKGGEDSDADDDDNNDSILPTYPAQGMGIYATNTTSNGVIRGADNGAGSGPIPSTISSNNNIVRKTTQINSLNPASAYSSTLLEGMNPASAGGGGAVAAGTTGMPFTSPYGDTTRNINPNGSNDNGNGNAKTFSNNGTSTYASQYYEQFVPYAEHLANHLSSSPSSSNGMSGTNVALIEKLNYIIHMLEEKKDEKSGHVIEELVLYCFLGIFIIFVVDTFARSGGVGAGGFGGMMGGWQRGAGRYKR
jgi:hypothetical protein